MKQKTSTKKEEAIPLGNEVKNGNENEEKITEHITETVVETVQENIHTEDEQPSHLDSAEYFEDTCEDFCEDECDGCCCDNEDCECEPECPLCKTGKKVAIGITIGAVLTAVAVVVCKHFKR